MIIDVNKIQEQFNKVIEYSQGVSEPCTNDLFLKWQQAKSRFIEKWGGLTYELDQDITLDRAEEDKKIIFQDYVADATMFASKGQEIAEFLKLQGVEGFFQNKVITKFECDDIKVNAGAKLSKSLKLFFDEEDKDRLNRFQIRLSRAVQDCKITGRMVMSVHPLDFISSSETAHNWHSCHALDGEYRAGNLSYMVDYHTFVVYLKADKEYQLPNFPSDVMWNSKKWRVLMYLGENEDILISGRQYPFASDSAFEIATQQLIGKFYDVVNNEWKNVGQNICSIMSDGVGALQYNDCLNSPTYEPMGCMTKEMEEAIDLGSGFEQMTIGEAVPCLECGGMNISITDDVRCDDCGDYCYCDHCGEARRAEDLYDLEGELVCDCCFDENGIYCDGCWETFNEFRTEMFWDDETECYYCESCYDNLLERREEEEHISTEGEL